MALFSWFTRARAGGPKADGSGRPKKQRNYGGVEVIPGKDASCEAVQRIAGKRFLPEEVPLFPLQDCDQADCDCTYKRYPDRRFDIRRAADVGFTVMASRMRQNEDRRSPRSPGRRAADDDTG